MTYDPFVLDLERRQITFFRSSKDYLPMFLIEEPEVVKALRARSVPWQ